MQFRPTVHGQRSCVQPLGNILSDKNQCCMINRSRHLGPQIPAKVNHSQEKAKSDTKKVYIKPYLAASGFPNEWKKSTSTLFKACWLFLSHATKTNTTGKRKLLTCICIDQIQAQEPLCPLLNITYYHNATWLFYHKEKITKMGT